MNTNALASDQCTLLATIDPDAATAAAYTSDFVDMSNFHAIAAFLLSGVMGASATINFKLVQATDSAGTGVKDIAGKAITEFVKASNDDDQAVINCRQEELDHNNGFTHAACVLTVGTATSDCAAAIMGVASRYAPTAIDSLQEVIS